MRYLFGMMIAAVAIRVGDAHAAIWHVAGGDDGFRAFVSELAGYGTALPEVPPKPLLFAQIETLEAVENAAEIAAVDGVDVLFVGPADLGFDLKARGSKLTVDELLPRIAESVLPSGKGLGILTRDDADVATRLELGYSYQAIDSDLGILRRRWQELTA